MSALVAHIEARAPALAARVLEEMYRNPFWLERFGERGRQFARQDGEFHLSYLVQALAAGDAGVLTGYARWLQPVLTTRGMCTRHIDENFARLARAIEDEIADAGAAIVMLDATRAALRYEAPAPRHVQDASAHIADEATADIYRRHPEWDARWGAGGRERCRDDIGYHLSYLADAIALDRPAVFTDYVAWIAAFLARRSIPVDHMLATLQVVRDVIVADTRLADASPAAARFLGDALEHLA